MNGTEFFQFENEIWYKKPDGTTEQLREEGRCVVKWMLDKIENFYPKALLKLKEIEKRSQSNITHYQFKVVDRFCRCNFGSIDNVTDINSSGQFRLEHVSCPLRGICKEENVICNPEFNSNISDAEMKVLEPLYRGENREYIADILCLSPHTVNNHIRNAFNRIEVHDVAEFIRYASDNKLFKQF